MRRLQIDNPATPDHCWLSKAISLEMIEKPRRSMSGSPVWEAGIHVRAVSLGKLTVV
ncbi:MAG: hypothetical protein KZQ65_11430 [Candidatus Thiodiazotropha sp. (ex Gloverina cf. vestifex)]|nr:hypothetical protein [Candidatus Thiodiazotropha sp. (ex Gloverina cf. vestifex)]